MQASYIMIEVVSFSGTEFRVWGTINSKINRTLKSFYLLISKLHFILAVANLLAHNNITISYYVQVNSLRLKSSVASKWASKHLWEYHLFCCWWYLISNLYPLMSERSKSWSRNINPNKIRSCWISRSCLDAQYVLVELCRVCMSFGIRLFLRCSGIANEFMGYLFKNIPASWYFRSWLHNHLSFYQVAKIDIMDFII